MGGGVGGDWEGGALMVDQGDIKKRAMDTGAAQVVSISATARATARAGMSAVSAVRATRSPYQPFGASLAPVLQQASGGALSAISWFRTDWQRGGALTGYATWHGKPVVVKLPVPLCELRWLLRLQDEHHDHGSIVPRVYGHGLQLGDYDIAWVVMERITHGPVGAAWSDRAFELLADATSRFYAAASSHELVSGASNACGDSEVTRDGSTGGQVGQAGRDAGGEVGGHVGGEVGGHDWHHVLKTARQYVREQHWPHAHRWKKALKEAQKKIDSWLHDWHLRPITSWIHGDLHLGNALSRSAAPNGPVLLIDFAHTRPGHWVQDAVYLEHVFWSQRERLAGHSICRLMAKHRQAHGMDVDDDWPKLAAIKRALLAMGAPARITGDGDLNHMDASLLVLEQAV